MKKMRLKKFCSFLLAGIMILTVFPYTVNTVYAKEETAIIQPDENEEIAELAEIEEITMTEDNNSTSDMNVSTEETRQKETQTTVTQNLLENDINNQKKSNSIIDINEVIEVPIEGMVITGGVYYGISKDWYTKNNPDGKVLNLSLTIPSNVTTIYNDGFRDSWSSKKQSQKCITNYNYDGDKTYTNKYTIVNIDFSKATSLTEIKDQAAMSCTFLTGVLDLSYTKLEILGKSAFNGCTGLTGVTFPKTLKNIGSRDSGSVFNGCTGLQFVRTSGGNPNATFELPEALEVLGKQSFEKCTGFPADTTVFIPASVTFVGSEVFDESANITTILVGTNDASAYDGAAFKENKSGYGLGNRLTVFKNFSAKQSFKPSGSNAYSNSLTYEFTLYYDTVKTEKKLWGQAVNVCKKLDGSWYINEDYIIPKTSEDAPVGYTSGWIYDDAVLTNKTVLKPLGDELTLSTSYVLQEPTIEFTVDGKVIETEDTYPKLNLSNDKEHTIGVDVSHPIETVEDADVKVKFEYEWTDVWKGGSQGPRMKEDGFGRYSLWDNPDVTNTITINGVEHERTNTGNYSNENYGDGYYLLEIYGYSCPKSGGQWKLFYKSASTAIASDPERTTNTAYLFDVVTSAPVQMPEVTFIGNSVEYGYNNAEIIATVSEIDGQTNTYQWYKASKENPSSQGKKIDGATSASLQIENGKDAGNYYYYLEVTSKKELNGDVVKTNFPVTFTVAKVYRQVSYQFESSDSDKELPQEVLKICPDTETKEYGKKVTPAKLQAYRVEVTDGVWLFESWSPEEVENLTKDTTFVGTWEYYPYQAVKANDLTVYEGGLGSHDSTETGDALPEPAWDKQMSGHTVTVDGKEWNVEKQGLPFTWKYLDEKGTEVTASARVGTYDLTVYPKDELKGKDVIIDGKLVLKLPENGLKVSTVKVRDVTNNDHADTLSTETFKNVYNYVSPQTSAISMFRMLTSDFSGSALDGTFDTMTGTHTGECNTSEPHAHVQEGTTFLKNGNPDMPVGSNARIGLLWDNFLEDVLGSEPRMAKLHEKSLQAVEEGTFNTDGTIHREFKYIDLVDMTDGNVWVGTAKNDVTVYYPYPEGVTQDSAIAVTYYDGLTRDYTVDMASVDLDNEISKSNAHPVKNLRKTETGILFDVPSKQFGPIEIMWQDTKTEILNEVPTISAEDKTLTVGDNFDPMKDVTASDKEDGDLTAKIEVINNTVDTSKAGAYTVTYKVTDRDGAFITKTITVTVKDKEEQSITPTKPDKDDISSNDKNNTASKGDNQDTAVQTGDSANLFLWSMVAVISLVGVITVLIFKRRKNR